MSTTNTWTRAIQDLMSAGHKVSPLSAGAAWRGKANRELIGYQTVIDMKCPVILSPARKLGLKFLTAEAAWICSGDNRVSTIAPYAKKIADMSDDGRRFFGAYGPKFIDQLSFVVETLIKDPASRQAVISIWREQPRATKDTPCTLSWQYLIRDGRLDCVATMRSSDIWTGWVYDVFNFSMAAAVVALELRQAWRRRELDDTAQKEDTDGKFEIELGDLYLTAGSQHLYDMDAEAAMKACAETTAVDIVPLDLNEFAGSEDLINYLWTCAEGKPSMHRFLSELRR